VPPAEIPYRPRPLLKVALISVLSTTIATSLVGWLAVGSGWMARRDAVWFLGSLGAGWIASDVVKELLLRRAMPPAKRFFVELGVTAAVAATAVVLIAILLQ
jgi:hypothetical protein